MVMNGGEIKFTMTLDSTGFTISAANVGNVVNRLRTSLNGTSDAASHTGRQIVSFGSKLRDVTFAISVLRFALHDIQDILLAFPKAILETSGQFEKLETLLKGVSKQGNETAKALEAAGDMKFIINLAQNAPFKIQALSDSLVKLRTAGMDAGNAQAGVKALSDAISKFGGGSEAIHRSSVALQQMMGKGVISMEELRQQLSEAIPDAATTMAESVGMTYSDFVALVSKGQVSAEHAINNMVTLMQVKNRGAAQEMMNTWPGLIEKLGSSWEMFKKRIGESGFLDSAKKAITEIINLMSSDAGRQFAVDIANAFNGAFSVVSALVKTFVELWDVIKVVGAAWLAFFVGSHVKSFFVSMSRDIKGIADNHVASQTAMLNATRARIAAENIATKAQFAEKVELLNRERLIRFQAQRAQMAAQLQMIQYQNRSNAAEQAAYQQAAYANANARTRITNTTTQINLLRAEREELRQILALQRQQSLGVDSQAGALNNMGRAAGFARGALTALKSAFSLTNIAIGIVTAAIGFAISKIIEWANAAENAMERANRAKDGGSTMADLKTSISEVEKFYREKIRTIQSQIAIIESGEVKSVGGYSKANLSKLKEVLAKNMEEYRGIYTQYQQHRANVVSNMERTEISGFEKSITILTKDLDTQTEKLITQQNEKTKEGMAKIIELRKKQGSDGAKLIAAEMVKLKKQIDATTNMDQLSLMTGKMNSLKKFKEEYEKLQDIGTVERVSSSKGGASAAKKAAADAIAELNDQISLIKKTLATQVQEIDEEVANGTLDLIGGYEKRVEAINTQYSKAMDLITNKLSEAKSKLSERQKKALASDKAVLGQELEKELSVEATNLVKKYNAEFAKVDDAFSKFYGKQLSEADSFGISFAKSYDSVEWALNDLIQTIAFSDTLQSKFPNLLEKLNSELAKLALAKEAGSTLAKLKDSFKQLEDGTKKTSDSLMEFHLKTLKSGNTELEKYAESTEALKLTKIELAEAEIELAKAIKISEEFTKGGNTATKDMTELLDKARAKVTQLKVSVVEMASALDRSFSKGARDALASYYMDITDYSKQGAEIVGKTFRGMEDAIVSFVTTGKANIKDMVTSIIADLVRLATRKFIMQPLAASFGLAGVADVAGASGGGAGGGTDAMSALSVVSGLKSIYTSLSTGIAAMFDTVGMAIGGVAETMGFSSATSGLIGSAASALGYAAVGFVLGKMISGGYSVIGKSGNTAVAVGTAIGAIFGPIGTLLGGIIGGAVNALFGRKLEATGIEGKFGGEDDGGFTGNNYEFYKGGLFRSDKTKRSELNSSVDAAFDAQYQALKVSALAAASALGGSSKALDNFTHEIKLNLKGMDDVKAKAAIEKMFGEVSDAMAAQMLDSMAMVEGITRQQDAMQTRTVQKMQYVVDEYGNLVNALVDTEITEIVPEIVANWRVLAKEGETASATLTRLSTTLLTINGIFDTLQLTMYKTSLTSAAMAQGVVDLFGGLDKTKEIIGAFYDAFYSNEEKLSATVSGLNDVFSLLGYELPSTKEGFRDIVESLDLTTLAGAQMFATLMNLAPQFAQLTDAWAASLTDLINTTDEVALSGETAYQKWIKLNQQIGSLTFNDLASSAVTMSQLRNATIDVRQQEFNLLGLIKARAESIEGMFKTTVDSIRMSVLDDSGKYNFLRTQIDAFVAELKTATDPNRISLLSNNINSMTNQAYGLLDPTQQQSAAGGFVSFLDEVSALANERFAASETKVKTDAQLMADALEASMGRVAAKMQGAADTQLAAASIPVTVNVDVSVDAPASVEVGQG